MKKLIVILALALMLVPAIVMAVPSYCTWNGDPVLRYSFNMTTYSGGFIMNPPGTYNQPGPDFGNIYAGQTITKTLGLGDAGNAGSVPGCGFTAAPDTFCFAALSKHAWTVSANPPVGTMLIQPNGAGYVLLQYVSITAPCSALPGDKDTLIVQEEYWNTKGMLCAPECGDCINPNFRSGVRYYDADTLILTVLASPPALAVFQDTLTLVDRGQTQAYIPFSICDQDNCHPATYDYRITSKGHVGGAINTTGTVTVPGGDCKDVYGIIDAGAASACNYDTLKIIAWTTTGPAFYDTCVQVIHVIEPQPVPLFTVPVVTILVLALILAAAVFMRRRAVSRA